MLLLGDHIVPEAGSDVHNLTNNIHRLARGDDEEDVEEVPDKTVPGLFWLPKSICEVGGGVLQVGVWLHGDEVCNWGLLERK